MAKETKFLEDCQDVENTITLWTNFGWELMGAPQSNIGQVNITFQRENTMPNHAELVNLQEEYDRLSDNIPSPPPEPVFRIGLCTVIVALICLFPVVTNGLLGDGFPSWQDLAIFLSISMFVLSIGFGIPALRYMRHRKKVRKWQLDYAAWEEEVSKINGERTDILRQAKSLLTGVL